MCVLDDLAQSLLTDAALESVRILQPILGRFHLVANSVVDLLEHRQVVQLAGVLVVGGQLQHANNLLDLVGHARGQVVSVLGGLVGALSALLDDVDVDLHAADENRSQNLDLLKAADENLAVHLMRQLLLAVADLTRNLTKARTQIFEELNQVFHGVNDLADRKVVENSLAFAHNLAHLGLVEAEQQL